MRKKQTEEHNNTQLPHAERTKSGEEEEKKTHQHIRSRKNGTVEATTPPSNIYNNFSYKDIARAILSIFI